MPQSSGRDWEVNTYICIPPERTMSFSAHIPNILMSCLFKNLFIGEQDGGKIGGSGFYFPSTPVKHLADLRSRANSQRHSSRYEDWRPKIEDIETLKDLTTGRPAELT